MCVFMLCYMLHLLWGHVRSGSAFSAAQRSDYPRELYVIKLQVWTQLLHTVCVCVCVSSRHVILIAVISFASGFV